MIYTFLAYLSTSPDTPVSLTHFLTVLAVIGGPASGIAIAIIANHRSKQTRNEEQEVQRKGIQVSERDAHTREIAVIIDGFTASNESLRQDFVRANAAATNCSERFETLRELYENLDARFEDAERQRAREREVMIGHIQVLEAQVPNPPGPPVRPTW